MRGRIAFYLPLVAVLLRFWIRHEFEDVVIVHAFVFACFGIHVNKRKAPTSSRGFRYLSTFVVLGQSGDAVGSGESELRAVGDDHIGVEGVEQRPAEDDVGDGVVPDRCPCGDATA